MWQGVNPWIEVDGGVSPANAYQLIEVGANALVAGSAVLAPRTMLRVSSLDPADSPTLRDGANPSLSTCWLISSS